MDATLAAALITGSISLLIFAAGAFAGLYQFRHKKTRQATQDFQEAQARHIDLLNTEIVGYKEQVGGLQKQVSELQIRNATMLQALSAVYRRPPEEIDWRLNNFKLPEARN